MRVTFQLRDLLHSAHVPYPHGVVPRACEKKGGGRSAAAEQDPKCMRNIFHDLSQTNMSRHLAIESPSQSYAYTFTTARGISRATQTYTCSNAITSSPSKHFHYIDVFACSATWTSANGHKQWFNNYSTSKQRHNHHHTYHEHFNLIAINIHIIITNTITIIITIYITVSITITINFVIIISISNIVSATITFTITKVITINIIITTQITTVIPSPSPPLPPSSSPWPFQYPLQSPSQLHHYNYIHFTHHLHQYTVTITKTINIAMINESISTI